MRAPDPLAGVARSLLAAALATYERLECLRAFER
jgi:hypothetical protein